MAYNYASIPTPNATNVTITSGTIDGTTVGATVPATGAFTSITNTGSIIVHTTTITGNYTVLSTDHVILVNNNPGAALTVTLPASPTTNMFVRIKDFYGNAATYNITIAGNGKNIDGASTQTIKVNYASADLVYSGTSWAVL